MTSLSILYRHLAYYVAAFCAFGWRVVAFADDESPLLPKDHPIYLLQPLDDQTQEILPVDGKPFRAFQDYFAMSWPWVIGCAAGVAVLWAIVGGMEIMLSGSDSGMRDKGKSRFINALTGLLLIGLSGMILEILNPIFFKQ